MTNHIIAYDFCYEKICGSLERIRKHCLIIYLPFIKGSCTRHVAYLFSDFVTKVVVGIFLNMMKIVN